MTITRIFTFIFQTLPYYYTRWQHSQTHPYIYVYIPNNARTFTRFRHSKNKRIFPFIFRTHDVYLPVGSIPNTHAYIYIYIPNTPVHLHLYSKHTRIFTFIFQTRPYIYIYIPNTRVYLHLYSKHTRIFTFIFQTHTRIFTFIFQTHPYIYMEACQTHVYLHLYHTTTTIPDGSMTNTRIFTFIPYNDYNTRWKHDNHTYIYIYTIQRLLYPMAASQTHVYLHLYHTTTIIPDGSMTNTRIFTFIPYNDYYTRWKHDKHTYIYIYTIHRLL